MVVNCLPLYQPPNEAALAGAEARGNRRSSSASGGRSRLIKARSMESISSSQLGDEEHQQAVGGVATPPRRKASQFSHYSITVHNRVDTTTPEQSPGEDTPCTLIEPPADDTPCTLSEPLADDAPCTLSEPQANGHAVGNSTEENTEIEIKTGVEEEEVECSLAGEGVAAADEASISQQPESGAEGSTSDMADESRGNEESDRPGGDDVKTETATAAESSNLEQAEDDDVLSEEVKAKPSDGKSNESRHRRLTKSRSARTSLSPEVDTSDSEEAGFSVSYVQDQHIAPQLKRSSGSVSFFMPPTSTSPKSGTLEGACQAVKETLLEMSGENKLDDDEGEGGGGGGVEGELPQSREKSLSTAKPPLLEETDSILQKSATVISPTAPTQLATPLSASTPPTVGDTAQAPPTQGNALALRASPLPPPPVTLDKDYTERSGWLNKLSHRKGVFGDKWQKRYFVLHRSWLYYFKKYGVCEVNILLTLAHPLMSCSLYRTPTRGE